MTIFGQNAQGGMFGGSGSARSTNTCVRSMCFVRSMRGGAQWIPKVKYALSYALATIARARADQG